MKANLYVRNARLVSENAQFIGGIAVRAGKISMVFEGTPDISAEKTIDLKGQVVFPGIIDSHVHFNDPGRTHWEGMRTGSMAAAAGGITTVVDMPLNNLPAVVNREILTAKLAAVKSRALVDFALYGGLVDDNLTDLEGMHRLGIVGFKAFLSNSAIPDFARVDDDILMVGLGQIRALDNLLVIHAENEYVPSYLAKQLIADGRVDRAAWTESRPPMVELEAIQRALYWVKQVKGRLHILHTTISEGMDLIHAAKMSGLDVTVETCPHYLIFDMEDFNRLGPVAKCAPPLRSSAEVESLWDAVLAGKVDTIGSDHSPCTFEEKAAGDKDIWKAWGGVSGIQTMLPSILTEGVHARNLPLSAVTRMLSSNPARIMGLYPQKGSFLPGSDADFTIVDLEDEWTLTGEDLYYKNPHSPFIGRSFKGRVVQTIVRGETVFQNGTFHMEPGYGQFLPRGYAQD
jgi:allantoinase